MFSPYKDKRTHIEGYIPVLCFLSDKFLLLGVSRDRIISMYLWAVSRTGEKKDAITHYVWNGYEDAIYPKTEGKTIALRWKEF